MKPRAEISIWGVACLALCLLTSSCTGDQAPVEDSLAAPGVLKCAELSAFGAVETLNSSGSSRSVKFSIERWVVPEAGDSSIVFDVDPDDRSWKVGDVGLLILPDSSPPLLLNSSQAEEVEQSWDGVNKPSSKDCDP